MPKTGYALHASEGWAVASSSRIVFTQLKYSLKCLFDKYRVLSQIYCGTVTVIENINRQCEKYEEHLTNIFAFGFLLLLMVSMIHPAYASGTDLLTAQDGSVTGTFGQGSSFQKWILYGEIAVGAFTYIRVRTPTVFVGFAMLVVFTRIGFALAG